jgi:hypothetical protein
VDAEDAKPSTENPSVLGFQSTTQNMNGMVHMMLLLCMYLRIVAFGLDVWFFNFS